MRTQSCQKYRIYEMYEIFKRVKISPPNGPMSPPPPPSTGKVVLLLGVKNNIICFYHRIKFLWWYMIFGCLRKRRNVYLEEAREVLETYHPWLWERSPNPLPWLKIISLAYTLLAYIPPFKCWSISSSICFLSFYQSFFSPRKSWWNRLLLRIPPSH